MRRPAVTSIAIALLVGVAGCTSAGHEQPSAPTGEPRLRLVKYNSCEQALHGLKANAGRSVTPYGLPGDSSARATALEDRAEAAVPDSAPNGVPAQPKQAAPDYSGTNVQEANVDEPDLVDTDGSRIVTISGDRLRVVDVVTRRVTATLQLRGVNGAFAGDGQLVLAGDRALVLFRQQEYVIAERAPATGPRTPDIPEPDAPEPGPVAEPIVPGSGEAQTQLVLVDLAGAPRVIDRLTVAGQYVDARRVGDTARVVVRSQPRLRFTAPNGRQSEDAAVAANRVVIARSTAADWLPTYQVERDGRSQQLRVPCDRLSHPASYTGSSLITVFTADLSKSLADGDPATFAVDGDTVYATADRIYLANNVSPGYQPGPLRAPAPARTELYALDTSRPGPPSYLAGGAVPGRLLNQYSLSDYDGHLRVATTTTDTDSAAGQSAVRVLARRGNALIQVGSVDGLGKGERIYAVRFVGPVGYVVTFRQVDPLYTVDLRDPARPKVVGELKITGYSAYLHPAGDGRLIGVGQEASPGGRRLGTSVSLFDVADPAKPALLGRKQLTNSNSEAEYDPHAFLYWPKTGLVAVPVNSLTRADGGAPEQGVLALRVRGKSLSVLGIARQPDSAKYPGGVRRTLLIGDELWTLSDGGLAVYDPTTLATSAWLPFA